MRISTPLTSRARKHKVVIQWVARTTAQCRGRTVVAGTAEAEVEPHTESAIYGIVPIGHTLCTRSGTPQDAASYSRALGYLAGHPVMLQVRTSGRIWRAVSFPLSCVRSQGLRTQYCDKHRHECRRDPSRFLQS